MPRFNFQDLSDDCEHTATSVPGHPETSGLHRHIYSAHTHTKAKTLIHRKAIFLKKGVSMSVSLESSISLGYYANSLLKESWMINWSRKTAPKEICLSTLTPVIIQGTSSQPQWAGRDLSGKVPQLPPMQPSLADSILQTVRHASEVSLCMWRKQGSAFLEQSPSRAVGCLALVFPLLRQS